MSVVAAPEGGATTDRVVFVVEVLHRALLRGASRREYDIAGLIIASRKLIPRIIVAMLHGLGGRR